MSLRILHVNTAGTGIGRYGAQLAEALTRLPGIEVRNVLSAETRGFLDVPGAVYVDWRRGRLPFSLLRVRREVRRFRPHVIHDSTGAGTSKGLFLWRFMVKKAPLVITDHDPVPHHEMGGGLVPKVRRALEASACRIIVHGPACRDFLVEAGQATAVDIIPHGVLDRFVRNAGPLPPRRENLVLFFGEFRPNKGFDWLPEIVDAVARHRSGVEWIVAGSGAVGRELRGTLWPARMVAILAELRSKPNVRVDERFVPDEEVGALFATADVCLLPYRDATQSGVALIAMPLGACLLATDVGDLPYLVEGGLAGRLVAPDPAEIARGLSELLGDSPGKERMRAHARARAFGEFSWPAVARKHLKSYEEAARAAVGSES